MVLHTVCPRRSSRRAHASCLVSGAALGPLLAGLISPSGWNNVFYMLMFADACALLVSPAPHPSCLSRAPLGGAFPQGSSNPQGRWALGVITSLNVSTQTLPLPGLNMAADHEERQSAGPLGGPGPATCRPGGLLWRVVRRAAGLTPTSPPSAVHAAARLAGPPVGSWTSSCFRSFALSFRIVTPLRAYPTLTSSKYFPLSLIRFL